MIIASIDYVRSVVLVMDFVVLWLYGYGSFRMVRAMLRNRDYAPHQTLTVARGRILRYGSVVFFTVASIEGMIELWGTGITPRILWVVIAQCCAMAGYLVVDRSFRDEDIFKYTAIESGTIGSRDPCTGTPYRRRRVDGGAR